MIKQLTPKEILEIAKKIDSWDEESQFHGYGFCSYVGQLGGLELWVGDQSERSFWRNDITIFLEDPNTGINVCLKGNTREYEKILAVARRGYRKSIKREEMQKIDEYKTALTGVRRIIK